MRQTLAFLQQEGRRLAEGSGNGHLVPSSENPSSTPWLKPKVTLSVEGNISAGKSTFLKMLQASTILQQKLQVRMTHSMQSTWGAHMAHAVQGWCAEAQF